MAELHESSMHHSRNRRHYNSTEMSKINVFKKQYLDAESAEARKHVFETMIAPALFSYWVEIGKPITGHEATGKAVKDLLNFIRNNWRKRIDKPHAAGYTVRRSDVLWWTRQDDVFAEIAVILGLSGADSSTEGWFPQRLRACKNIIDGMSATEIAALDAQVEAMKMRGIPPHIQMQLAEKKWAKRFDHAATDRYRELGVLSLSFVVFYSPSGQLSIDVHDQMADLMGVNAQTFETRHSAKVIELKRLIIDHVKALQALLQPATATSDAASDVVSIPLGEGRFPLVPMPWNDEAYSKKQLEDLFRAYLGQHYYLATRGRTTHVPYSDIRNQVCRYIEAQYMPRSFQMSKPRDMKKEDIARFFEHIAKRQIDPGLGPQQAFRFHAVKKHRKGTDIIPATYEIDSDGEGNAQEVVAQKPARTKASRKGAETARDTVPSAQHEMQGVWSIHSAEGLRHVDADTESSVAAMPLRAPILSEHIVISHQAMVAWQGASQGVWVPVNGPGDGPPMYEVPRHLYEASNGNSPVQQTEDTDNRHPSLVSPRHPSVISPRHPRKTADSLALAEAHKYHVDGKLRKRRT